MYELLSLAKGKRKCNNLLSGPCPHIIKSREKASPEQISHMGLYKYKFVSHPVYALNFTELYKLSIKRNQPKFRRNLNSQLRATHYTVYIHVQNFSHTFNLSLVK